MRQLATEVGGNDLAHEMVLKNDCALTCGTFYRNHGSSRNRSYKFIAEVELDKYLSEPILPFYTGNCYTWWAENKGSTSNYLLFLVMKMILFSECLLGQIQNENLDTLLNRGCKMVDQIKASAMGNVFFAKFLGDKRKSSTALSQCLLRQM